MKETVPAYRRHDISDETWALLEPHLPGRKGAWGGIARDNRLFINAVFWILRTGAPCCSCRRTMAAGATRTAVLCAGGTRGFLISKILQPDEANEQGVIRWSRRRRADGGEGNRDESVG